MPILDYGKRPDNWELIPSLSKGEIFIFRQFVFDAKKKFKYKNDKKFLKTLEPNMDFSKPYIYTFDSEKDKTSHDDQYMIKLKELIEASNKEMFGVKTKNKELKDYKLDIMGTWNYGYIVVMRKTNSNSSLALAAKNATVNRLKDSYFVPNFITDFL